MTPSVEILESRDLPSSVTVVAGLLRVIGDPAGNRVVLTDHQLTLNGQPYYLDGIGVQAVLITLGNGTNTVLNYSHFATTYLLGGGANTIYGGRGPDLVVMSQLYAGPHALDAIVDPWGVNAIDVRGGPAVVLTNAQTAVAADHAAEVFRFMLDNSSTAR